jgi:KDO2-lipid IV(A) lauroyltransferase
MLAAAKALECPHRLDHMLDWLQFIPVWLCAKLLGVLPGSMARAVGTGIGRGALLLHRRLRRVGQRNLQVVFPAMPQPERRRILRGVFTTLGRQLADFCQLPRMNAANVAQTVRHEGLQNYLDASARGKGVLFVTAHLGGWEIGSYAQAVYGHPLHIVARALDNQPLDLFVTRMRTRSGNRVFNKDDFARGLLAAMKAGETVGILMDTNMTPPQGVFVDFLGRAACTASGLARVALRTDAAVVPGFTVWHEEEQRYVIHFEPALELVRTGDEERDIVANTQQFTKVIEEYVRRYPEQWLWVHRRWKARPPGEGALY